MEFQKISSLLLECVKAGDVVRARRLLTRVNVNERDRKSIVAKRGNRDPPLFVAAKRGNVDMVEFLVTECHADTEERGTFADPVFGDEELFTPLWCAATLNDFEVLNVLINLGADINAALDTGSTPVLTACKTNVGIVKFLVEHGADIKKPDNTGKTCLMQAVWSKEICQILIDNNAEVNAQDSSGNTALHWAIYIPNDEHPDKEDIVQLLIDHDSDPNIKNEDGDDVFLAAVSEGQLSILNKLLLKVDLSVRRRIELYDLLGAVNVQNSWGEPIDIDIEKVLTCWKKTVEMRKMYPCYDDHALQPNPVYLSAREVNTVEELEALSRNHDLLYMHAMMITERILGPGHIRVQSGLRMHARIYKEKGEFRRCIDIARYIYQLQNTCVDQLTSPFNVPNSLEFLCLRFCEAYSNNCCRIDFEEVFEVLRMVTFNLEVATETYQMRETWRVTFMIIILQLIKLITELDKSEVQLFDFKKIVHCLVRKELKTPEGQMLLHLSVKQSTPEVYGEFFLQFPSMAVVELLLECGANVNAVDNENNTVLHLCSKDLQNQEMKQHHDVLKRIAVVLLKNKAHVDMVNISGDNAAKSLSSSLIDINTQDYVSLKCLAACVVLKYNISYVGYIPASLEYFVQMHGQPTANPKCESPIKLSDYLKLKNK